MDREAIREMSDREIKTYYYGMIQESRSTFSQFQRIESILDSPLLISVYMVLWGLVTLAVVFLFLIPDLGLDLLGMFGIPLGILLLITRRLRKTMISKQRLVNHYHRQLDNFRYNLEKENRDIPDYPFQDTELHYLPFDQSGHLTDDHIRD
ncbi:hypothetical protein QA612_22220 [Evansella sp. AB-P1]|uniref:hypothetical protein n=1 Tax=Evansella sp. AB-P1 TaxID=3037653 RepID=UPI00241D02E3|nr:hypothetical protein [Evansella sp. AB-P1]MDG5790159.1 hypothetical protein [Evansella sp. AB-P1]